MGLSNEQLLYFDWMLILVFFLTFCQQLFAPRFNFYGIISILSISTYIGIHTLATGFNALVLILFLGSISLIILEMFMPGGILGVLGILTLIGSIVIINEQTQYISLIIMVSICAFVALYLANIYIFKRKLLFLNKFVLEDGMSTEKGYVAKESEVSLLGQNLVAFTDLRPAGTATLNDKKYDVVTEGDFIEKGSNLVVTHIEGMRIVVRKI